jgi:glutamate/tyrosine decarboxylase-like PLP-dependent enzyme
MPALSAFCRAHDIWLHVDAAYGGFAVLTEQGRAHLAGLDQVDSVTLDPHKLLYQPFETGCLLVRDGALLERAFRVMPVYLQDTVLRDAAATAPAADGGVNFGERGIQLTRSARALNVWVSLHYFGVDAFRTAIARTMSLAQHAEARIRASDAFELLTPASFGIVCFRRRMHGAAAAVERANAALVKRLAASGEGMISSTRLKGVYALRLCILSHRTGEEDVDRVLRWLETAPLDQPAVSR